MDMYYDNNGMQVVDVLVTIILFVVSCAIGKVVMNYFGESVISFNIPAIVILALGGLGWKVIRKKIQENKG